MRLQNLLENSINILFGLLGEKIIFLSYLEYYLGEMRFYIRLKYCSILEIRARIKIYIDIYFISEKKTRAL